MGADTTLNSGTGGDTIRAVDKAGIKAQVVVLDIGGAGAESLLTGTLPVSAATLPLPSGAASSAKQDTGNTSLSSIDGKITAVNTGAVVVSSSALPSGASTAARQDTGNTSVASIDTKTPALGQALSAASVPVVLPAAQITTLTPPAAITGFALETGHLAAIDTSVSKIPSQGQALAAASMPVVLTAVQISTLTPLTTVAITAASLPLPANAAQETGGNLASINTSNAPFLVPAAGGYVRQDSTATIAKESGGNLAALVSVLGTTSDAEVRTDVVGTIASRLLSMSVQLQELIDQQKNTNAFLFRLAFANRVSNGERILKKV